LPSLTFTESSPTAPQSSPTASVVTVTTEAQSA